MILLLALLAALQAPGAPPGPAGQEPPALTAVEELGLRIAPGFKVTLYSDQTLANDIYAMTLDSRGRVVVTSQGWIKILEDPHGRGKAETATVFAETRSGGMGMRFDGNDLLFSGDNGLWRYRDPSGSGKADGPPVKIARFVSGEHGHHAIRKGPDGSWYLIGGNDAGIGKGHITMSDSPIREPRTGAILRYSPDFSGSEVIADGFRNPYDFDFDADGDIYTYDSDCERDYLLPWYTPTRIFQVGYGLHHGWRLTGYLRSYANRDAYPDTVDILWAVGRGSPTGVVNYRHHAFPARYHGGLFALDWTFGKVYFIPPGAKKGEIFLEPTGTEGFAPTGIAVAPDGALFISIGGRRTRGAVYRIEPLDPRPSPSSDDPLLRVLDAEQPLDAWSRARWEPAARTLGAGPFEKAALDSAAPEARRIRALEILVDLFGGPSKDCGLGAARSPSARVRSRAAWAMGRRFQGEFAPALGELSAAPEDFVRRAALEAIADRLPLIDPGIAKSACLCNLDHPRKRVRQAAGRLYALISAGGDWVTNDELFKRSPRALLTALVAPSGGRTPLPVLQALRVLGAADTADLRADALRAIVLGLGDTNLAQPSVEVLSNYEVAQPPEPKLREEILSAIRPLFPSQDAYLDEELARILAMLRDEAPETVAKVAAKLTPESSPASDVHYLIVLARLGARWPAGTSARAAGALLSLGRKLEGTEQRGKQTWGTRISEIAGLLGAHDPAFADDLLRNPLFVSPGHVGIAAAMGGSRRADIARLFLGAVRKDPGFAWSEALVTLLSDLPPEEFHPALRAQWTNYGMRDSILLHLGASPSPEDRDKFLTGVESANPQAARVSLEALARLPRDESEKNLVPLLRLLRRLTLEPKQASLRKLALELVERESGKSFPLAEVGTDPLALKKLYQPVFDAFGSLKDALEPKGAVDLGRLLKPVPWDEGDRARGELIFRSRGCQTCHAVQGALGPNLVGAASRFSREDLFDAIANPSKDIAPAYRTTLFQMKDGSVYTGIVAFESADGYIVQTGATTTVRINTPDIAGMRPGTLSLMPEGLVEGLVPRDLADLYAFLRNLGK